MSSELPIRYKLIIGIYRIIAAPILTVVLVLYTPLLVVTVSFDTWRARRNPDAEPLMATWEVFKAVYPELWRDVLRGRL